ncbi:hypothetical protein [uncultured Methylobacterium sp.]|uniref:hypothetical protein n=1 Tax=uncultured Methylobacterium sp. TaxID=157278 RepID=UPI0035CAB5F9
MQISAVPDANNAAQFGSICRVLTLKRRLGAPGDAIAIDRILERISLRVIG